jgi:hypothetical protein
MAGDSADERFVQAVRGASGDLDTKTGGDPPNKLLDKGFKIWFI